MQGIEPAKGRPLIVLTGAVRLESASVNRERDYFMIGFRLFHIRVSQCNKNIATKGARAHPGAPLLQLNIYRMALAKSEAVTTAVTTGLSVSQQNSSG
jgi:hypothetical protein